MIEGGMSYSGSTDRGSKENSLKLPRPVVGMTLRTNVPSGSSSSLSPLSYALAGPSGLPKSGRVPQNFFFCHAPVVSLFKSTLSGLSIDGSNWNRRKGKQGL